MVTVPYHPAMADGYIDDVITVTVDEDNYVEKGQHAAPLAVHCVFRPVKTKDPLPRDDAVSIRKLDGEGTPDEVKNCLGWNIDTRKFRIYLPKGKANQWTADLRDLLELGKVNSKTIDCIIGRLNHTAHIIPQAR